jgi:hypothetical protein
MPAFIGADGRTTEGFAPAGAVARSDRVGVYLTNEVFLYRVVGVVASGADELVELEDCFGLDVVPVPLEELRARGLRVVIPARV